MPLMLLSLIMGRIESAPLPFFIKPVAKGIVAKVRGGFLTANVERHLDFMEKTLSQSTWICGDDITAADIQMSFPIEAAEVRTNLTDGYPNLAGFLTRIRTRPAYQLAIEKGGPYQIGAVDKK